MVRGRRPLSVQVPRIGSQVPMLQSAWLWITLQALNPKPQALNPSQASALRRCATCTKSGTLGYHRVMSIYSIYLEHKFVPTDTRRPGSMGGTFRPADKHRVLPISHRIEPLASPLAWIIWCCNRTCWPRRVLKGYLKSCRILVSTTCR